MLHQKHQPVFLNQTIKTLNIKKNGIYVDCTLGFGGHSKVILEKLENGKLYSLDQDQEAIKAAYDVLKDYKNVEIIASNFCYLKKILQLRNVNAVDGILYDLGVSSPQLDEKERGFSYHQEAVLDMRMDQSQVLTAKDIVNKWTIKELSNILWKYGEEQFHYQIAKNIVNSRQLQPIITTTQLVNIIKKSLPMKVLKKSKHPARKTFQALRIAVNDELNNLKISLKQAASLLKSQGVLVIITFHSLEDRIVKNFFKELVMPWIDPVIKQLPIQLQETSSEFELITVKPLKATTEDIKQNYRSRSAKLRAIRKI